MAFRAARVFPPLAGDTGAGQVEAVDPEEAYSLCPPPSGIGKGV